MGEASKSENEIIERFYKTLDREYLLKNEIEREFIKQKTVEFLEGGGTIKKIKYKKKLKKMTRLQRLEFRKNGKKTLC